MSGDSAVAWPSADDVEQRFGDPYVADNPLGFAAILDEAPDSGFAAGARAFVELRDHARATSSLQQVGDVMHALGLRDLRMALACASSGLSGCDAQTLTPPAIVGCLDACLGVTLRHTLRRRLHGHPVADIPAVRSSLVDAFAEIIVCDALANASLSDSLDPSTRHSVSVAAQIDVPRSAVQTADRLAEILGAYFYVRDGDTGIFQKHRHDLRMAVMTSSKHRGDVGEMRTLTPSSDRALLNRLVLRRTPAVAAAVIARARVGVVENAECGERALFTELCRRQQSGSRLC